MIKRDDYKYLTLDAMPFVITPDDKAWVFARTTKKWEPADDENDWDAVYPNWDSWWEDMFAELPELPEGAISQEFVMAQKPPSTSDTVSSSKAQKAAAPTTKSAPTLNPSTKPPYDLTRYPSLVDVTSERLGRGYVIGGAPSAKPRGKNS